MSIKVFLPTLLLSLSVNARYAMQDIGKVPIKRLITNLESEYKNQPGSAHDIKVSLARLYAMAYAYKKNEQSLYESIRREYVKDGKTVILDEPWFGYEPPLAPLVVEKAKNAAEERTSREYLKLAIENYESVQKRWPDDERAMIGLAWCLLQANRLEEAKVILRKSFAKSYAEESKRGTQLWGAEIGAYLIRSLDPVRDKQEIDNVSKKMNEVSKFGRQVTPIIIPMYSEQTNYEALTAGSKTVRFDLDGSGVSKEWKWIGPNAGWLVYSRGEHVTSALQMFGNVTFWIFWKNGYQALSSLDDNHDSVIDGDELDGLMVWNDKNQDGICDNDELRSLQSLNIVGLDTRYRRNRRGILESKNGLKMADGKTRPTYDFVSQTR